MGAVVKHRVSISAAFGDAVALLAGTTVVRIGVTGAHRSFVRPSFGPYLIVSGVLVSLTAALRLLGVVRRANDLPARNELPAADDGHDHGHSHGRMPLVSMAFVLPALAFFLAGSATLGSYAADRTSAKGGSSNAAAVTEVLPPLAKPQNGLFYVSISDVDVRHAYGPTTDIVGRKLRLVGFASRDDYSLPGANTFTLTRFRILCCAADAIAVHVNIEMPSSAATVPATDSWVEVVGTFVDPTTPFPANGRPDRPLVRALSVKAIKRPADPFE